MMNRPADLPRAALTACRVLLAKRVDSLPVDPLRLLRACRDTCVCTAEEAADDLGIPWERIRTALAGVDAVTFRDECDGRTRYVILYQPDGHPARLRFTLAHELGHRLLGHTGQCAAEEREADCFASHLLCPDPVLHAMAGVSMADAAQHLAAACYISLSCARMSLRRPRLVLPEVYTRGLEELLAAELHRLRNVFPKDE